MGKVFRFKEFEVDQGNCAMKINTDGVILGGLADGSQVKRILDIGTGTGVIAMMLAQRYPSAYIDAVEIDRDASEQARVNFRNSIFDARLTSIYGSFEDMLPVERYDLIVSNPPFYTNSLRNPDPRKGIAKHADYVFFERLLDFVEEHLSPHGQFQLIVPLALAEEIVDRLLPVRTLFLHRDLAISSFPEELPIRKLLTIGRSHTDIELDTMAIYKERNVYSDRYKDILRPYFLAF
ncbi:tRNA1(Val) (adenine(37)-N6)-methyltransferase [Sphingobacterium sp. LRF_L2]|uniref:tRNA1(Val) (adenine(37)-N6)-methyltransferase n=1 Tax=Sphingobacterium sp. LRF_L2 TaxID=3369421 RepID=UPI003F623ADD